jgi:hypothetical protein
METGKQERKVLCQKIQVRRNKQKKTPNYVKSIIPRSKRLLKKKGCPP